MAGHNKWSKVKRKKATTDAEKSRLFGKVVRLLSLEVKKAKGNLEAPAVKRALDKARQNNLPKENIERALRPAEEDKPLEEITYEAYGPGGAALIILALTDNRHKAAAEIKHILNERGGALSAPGSALWAFRKEPAEGFQPLNPLKISAEDGEKLAALIEKLEDNDEVQEVFTNAILP